MHIDVIQCNEWGFILLLPFLSIDLIQGNEYLFCFPFSFSFFPFPFFLPFIFLSFSNLVFLITSLHIPSQLLTCKLVLVSIGSYLRGCDAPSFWPVTRPISWRGRALTSAHRRHVHHALHAAPLAAARRELLVGYHPWAWTLRGWEAAAIGHRAFAALPPVTSSRPHMTLAWARPRYIAAAFDRVLRCLPMATGHLALPGIHITHLIILQIPTLVYGYEDWSPSCTHTLFHSQLWHSLSLFMASFNTHILIHFVVCSCGQDINPFTFTHIHLYLGSPSLNHLFIFPQFFQCYVASLFAPTWRSFGVLWSIWRLWPMGFGECSLP